jgi:hypothetical protein
MVGLVGQNPGKPIRNMTDFSGNLLNMVRTRRRVKACSEAETRAARDKVAVMVTGHPFGLGA